MSVITSISACVIFCYSVWACLSNKYRDGIIGKLLFCASSLISLSILLTGQHADWLNVAFAILCLRNFIVVLIMPHIIKKYPCFERRKNEQNGD